MRSTAEPPDAASAAMTARKLWLLFGRKAGDNAQVQALGDALCKSSGWNYTIKHLHDRKSELLLHLFDRPTLMGITGASATALGPPWPDLVISAGRRSELVARWIKQQSPTTRLVHMGRPWSHPRHFDLIIATPQYALAGFDNALINELPLHRTDNARLAAARQAWAPVFASLSQPRSVLLVGGNSGPYVFDQRQARRLADMVNACMARWRGSLLVTTSPRTPARFARALLEGLNEPAFSYQWGTSPGDNPYHGLLAWGDRFIVTEESVSMTAEAIATRKPTYIFSLRCPSDPAWWRVPGNYAWKPLTHRLAMRCAPPRLQRDVRGLQCRLVADGKVQWLSVDPPTPLRGPAVGQHDLSASVARVAALFEGRPP